MKAVMVAGMLWLSAASAVAWSGGPAGEEFVPGARLERNLEELGLEPAKLDALRALIADSRREGEAQRERMRSARQEMHALLDADAPDEREVMDQVERIGELRTEAHKSLLRTLLAVRAQLTPEQREQLRAKMREDLAGARSHRRRWR
jgi:Spy/CpxP family protein refolding chaperone